MAEPRSDRLTLFVDAQNVYRGARECFGALRHTDGQIDPVALGRLLCTRTPPNVARTLHEVRVYTGRPDSTRQPRAYAAHMRQCAVWARSGVVVVPRVLRYPPGWPAEPAREKGIDVELAIDFIALALDRQIDAGVIFSTDTDLRPALEFVSDRLWPSPRVETAAWQSESAARALRLTNPRSTWVHYLSRADYASVHDATDYNLP